MSCTKCGNVEEYSGYDNPDITYTCSSCVQIMIQPLSLGQWARKITDRNVALGLQLITGWDDRIPQEHRQDIVNSIKEVAE